VKMVDGWLNTNHRTTPSIRVAGPKKRSVISVQKDKKKEYPKFF
jgi:hypothetical protein